MQRDNHVHVAFVGNPNCGKTTLFNAITGSKLKVANWPGVTVEKYEGTLEYEGYGLKLVDTPGHLLPDLLYHRGKSNKEMCPR